MSSRICTGSDGIRARKGGEWAKEKLDFLSYYGPVALTATAKKPERHFLDLFAGPGLNCIKNSPEEFDGSPLRAIELSSTRRPPKSFTDCWFLNLDRRDHIALEKRIDGRVKAGRSRLPRNHVHCIHGDANVEVLGILDAIQPRDYILAFADMEAPKQCPWSTIRALREHRDHTSVDLYVLFPLDMALKRLISRNQKTVAESAHTLNAFFGNEKWRELQPHRAVNSEGSRAELGRGLLDMYRNQLQSLWKYVEVVADIRRGTSHQLYKMMFASNNTAGRDIALWAKKRTPSQMALGL